MSNLLFEYSPFDALGNLMNPLLDELERQEICAIRRREMQDVTADDIAWCDIVIDVRGFCGVSERIVNEAHRLGRFVVELLDDDLLYWKSEYYPGIMDHRQGALRSIMEQADAVLCINRLLGEKYSQEFGIPFAVTEVAVPKDAIVMRREKDEPWPVKMVYAGNPEHYKLFNEFVAPVLPDLAAEYGRNLSLTLLGPQVEKDSVSSLDMDIRFVDFMPYDQYLSFMKAEQFDIGLAPMPKSDFHCFKHYNKFMEYSKQGIVGVYSNVEPFSLIVQDGKNGILTANDTESWSAALRRLIDNKELREACVRNAQKQLETDFDLATIAQRLGNDLPQLRDYKAPVVEAASVKLGNLKRRKDLIFKYHERLVMVVYNRVPKGKKG